MLSVRDGVANNTLEESLENTSGLLVDHGTAKQVSTWEEAVRRDHIPNSLYTTSASKTTDRRLCDTLDVISENLAVSLRATLSETLATFSACKEDALVVLRKQDTTRGRRCWCGEGGYLRPVMMKV
jgi:hypothetical protein